MPARRERARLGAPTEVAPVDPAPVERAFEAERVKRWFAADMLSNVGAKVFGFRCCGCGSDVLVERTGFEDCQKQMYCQVFFYVGLPEAAN